MRRTNLAAASSSSSSSSLLPPRRHRRRVMASFQDAEDEARKAIAEGFEMCVPFVVVQKDRIEIESSRVSSYSSRVVLLLLLLLRPSLRPTPSPNSTHPATHAAAR